MDMTTWSQCANALLNKGIKVKRDRKGDPLVTKSEVGVPLVEIENGERQKVFALSVETGRTKTVEGLKAILPADSFWQADGHCCWVLLLDFKTPLDQALVSRFFNQNFVTGEIIRLKGLPLDSDLLQRVGEMEPLSADYFGSDLGRRLILSDKAVKVIYDPEVRKCLSKLIRYYSIQNKRAIEYDEAWHQYQSLRLNELFDNTDEAIRAMERLVRKYAQQFDRSKLPTTPVFSGAFSNVVREIPEDQLQNRRQQFTHEEVEYLLYRITKRIAEKQGQPVAMNYQYLIKMFRGKGPRMRRKMNRDKVAYILKLLCDNGLLKKTPRHRRASLFSIGERNPYYDYEWKKSG